MADCEAIIPCAHVTLGASAPTISAGASAAIPKASITIGANPPDGSVVSNQEVNPPKAGVDVGGHAPRVYGLTSADAQAVIPCVHVTGGVHPPEVSGDYNPSRFEADPTTDDIYQAQLRDYAQEGHGRSKDHPSRNPRHTRRRR